MITAKNEATFSRLDMVLKPGASINEQMGVLNPASARLRDGTLVLYPRMVAPGNVSRIGLFRAQERSDDVVEVEPCGYALRPHAHYEFRTASGGHGCEDPRVTYIRAIDKYVMLYVAFGSSGPAIAAAISNDGLKWRRLGPVHFRGKRCADKDAAFFPEPVTSPSGIVSLAFYHRPTLQVSVDLGAGAVTALQALPQSGREGIAIAYVPLAHVQRNIEALCAVSEMHPLVLPPASWGTIKVGAGTPPVRIPEGWLSVIHGVDPVTRAGSAGKMCYSAGVVVHDAVRLDRVIYRSRDPLFVPELPGEIQGTVGDVVFPTAIDRRNEREFDIYYGMADYSIGRGRLTLPR